MTTVVIMQPTYLPWAGYFNLILRADHFVFLDDVQFEHQSWQTRNRICCNNKKLQLVVPIERQPLNTPFCKIRVDRNDRRWRKKHFSSIHHAYGKAPHGKELIRLLAPYYQSDDSVRLCDLNIDIITKLANYLGVTTSFHRSSELGCKGNRSERLLSICRSLGAKNYLSPQGSADYLKADGVLPSSDVDLEFQDFRPTAYFQYNAQQFMPYLSIIDVIANLGKSGSFSYISGEGEAYD